MKGRSIAPLYVRRTSLNRHHERPAEGRTSVITDSAARQLSLILPAMARLDLTDDEREELLRLLRGVISGDRFPLSPRIQRLKAIIEKLEPPAAAVEIFPAPRPPGEPTHARRRRR